MTSQSGQCSLSLCGAAPDGDGIRSSGELLSGNIIAQHQIQFKGIPNFSGNGRNGVVRLSVCLSAKINASSSVYPSPCFQNNIPPAQSACPGLAAWKLQHGRQARNTIPASTSSYPLWEKCFSWALLPCKSMQRLPGNGHGSVDGSSTIGRSALEPRK